MVLYSTLSPAMIASAMRTAYVLFRILPLFFSFRRDVRRWIFFGGTATRTPAFHRRRAERLVATIAGLGPSFVKMAQVFAGRADLLPEPYLSAISALADRVPEVPAEAIEREIIAAYGRPVHELFEVWDGVPVAAASLGQVHRAQYQGREVAVKVLRPNVEQLVAADIVAARWILERAESLFPNPHIRGLHAIVDEFSRRIGSEMDFRQEAAFATEIRHNFAKMPDVVIPEIVEELTRQRVLVMEFMHGTTLDKLQPLIDAGRVDPYKLVRTVMEVYVQMMMIDGLFHADPHPGNILVRDDGTLILLDFGLVMRVPRETRLVLVRTIFAAIHRDAEAVTDGFIALGVVTPGTDRTVILRVVETLLGVAFNRTTAQERIAIMTAAHEELLADRVLTTLYDFPVMLPADLVYFARTAALIEGIGVRYDARFNTLAFVTPLALRLRPQIFESLGIDIRPSPPVVAKMLQETVRDAAAIVWRAGKELVALTAGVAARLSSNVIP
jgi:predicted unusual protein kinase regulating ubiquinone biosynthesis (AarF/ABC1/UbiB family)